MAALLRKMKLPVGLVVGRSMATSPASSKALTATELIVGVSALAGSGYMVRNFALPYLVPTPVHEEAAPAPDVPKDPVEVTEAAPVQPPIGENPPIIEVEVPPVVEAEAPPVVEVAAPPVVEAEAPPIVEAEAPPVVEAEASPVVEAEAPPVVEAEAPPVVEAEAPPSPVFKDKAPPV